MSAAWPWARRTPIRHRPGTGVSASGISAARNADQHEELVAALKLTRENLRACQGTIHLAGGFDPAYVDDAQAAMAVADAVLAKAGA